MQIREMNAEDYKCVDRLMQQVHQLHVKNRPDLYVEQEPFFSKEEYLKLIEDENMISAVAEEENEVVGLCFVSMRVKTCMVYRHTAYMDDLCVDKSYQGMGIGRRLFQYAEARAKEKGAERLDLMVWSFNEKARAFYESLGMKPQRYILEKHL